MVSWSKGTIKYIYIMKTCKVVMHKRWCVLTLYSMSASVLILARRKLEGYCPKRDFCPVLSKILHFQFVKFILSEIISKNERLV